MLQDHRVQCPYCWESIEILVDASETEQDTIEDCSVCCRPIHLRIHVSENGETTIEALHEDEV
ncbi:CPXCG motif-containing cysteine-rich protein [Thiomicrorhabdus sp. zzn3]|uniref:CPXCG motif-containing cysteine-rich protein n=1 Tax=Thiomicrorhabdus sp. zzn3 TaxID=3039775 RepID=UPI0024368486|nr:CPXCG motif-containing cysteine-rich protein [Thiomicrorhabdus sp. zzn3]MDG6778678.1 CPXCG motif-containing cysteine-rich protein [Thiomicrorhabdus sp. zzn3]